VVERPPARALDGLRVVELGGAAPAFCGRWLAAFGAAVVRVEPPDGGPMRRYHPWRADAGTDDRGPLDRYLNPGKHRITLDLDVADGRAALHGLLADADVLVHDLEPARRRALGPSGAALREAYPRLVEVAVSPFGEDGPYAGHVAAPIVLLALGGFQFLSGEPGREPLALPGLQPDYLTGLYAVIAALAGVLGRSARGAGCRVELAALEVMASLHQFTVSQYQTQGTIRSRHGSRWENLYPITLLPCKDGYIGMAITTPDQWERLCAMMGRPELIDDPRFATSPQRRAHADDLDAILIEWLRDQDKRAVFHRAQEEWRLPVAPLYDLGEVPADPQLAARRFWVTPEPDRPHVRHPGLPVTLSATPWAIGPAPHGTDEGGRTAGKEDEAPAAPYAPSILHPSSLIPHPAETPLTGVRVLDFTRVWAGPLCTRILCDLGAEVIKVEAPLSAAAAVGAGPNVTGSGAAPLPRAAGGFGKHNRNKLSVCIDLRTGAGRTLVRRLAATCDVLVENFSARVMPNFGLGYEALRAINPGLVMLAMSGFGAEGPYRDYAAYGPAIEHMTGLTSLLGYPGEGPLATAIAYPDAVAGVTGAAAVLVALAHRRRTGAGQLIDMSQVEATINLIGEYLVAHQEGGEIPLRAGNAHPTWAPHGAYRCRGNGDGAEATADAWVSIAVRSDEEWRRLCAVAGLDDLGRDPALATAAGRRAHRERIDAALAAWTATRDPFAVMATLQAVGVPAGAVTNARELLEEPQLNARGFYVDARRPDGTAQRMAGTPFVIDGRRRADWRAAPALGEHNRAVLRGLLGMSDDEIDALEAAGVLGGQPAAVPPAT
jgi:crotonobetainyl-CoA:carnitine CoA-transferase CaiB-like acyl-CoA transferase